MFRMIANGVKLSRRQCPRNGRTEVDGDNHGEAGGVVAAVGFRRNAQGKEYSPGTTVPASRNGVAGELCTDRALDDVVEYSSFEGSDDGSRDVSHIAGVRVFGYVRSNHTLLARPRSMPADASGPLSDGNSDALSLASEALVCLYLSA
ncbi:hypothetical protein PHSY_001845 [Pseudozyma hubeiensis SY62]|uniref:Uncharacterized protein n=1 Tax=Pseudozyma hubeiensis (strain SY62) TaxID=1305764 RepID=R9NZP7_PSEHS|nr:hypothetical protein PHSY_001845 [Pseudozyma hubeiensis SY62]GAC94274.1 hypothetical protein PHSY_001845 [Pseudozyma hubeiensis SY62]